MKDFKGKVAVITGAASGIGFGLAERCAKEGMKVVLADIEKGALEKAEKDIQALGATTLAVITDVSKASDVEALAQQTLDAFGAVHLLFNNAGIWTGFSVWKSSLVDWEWILGVNLWGVIHGIYFFIPIMLKQDSECHIVNTASVSGLKITLNEGPYGVSKHGIVALSERLYVELAQEVPNIGVSVLCPGWVNTKAIESERNRPSNLKNKSGEGINMADPGVQSLIKAFTRKLEGGMSPQEIAKIVFDAIREKKFYIIPNAELDKPLIRNRMENILNERNPSIVNVRPK